MLNSFKRICANILDRIAPVKLKRHKVPPQPRVDDDIQSLKTDCSRAEHERQATKGSCSAGKLKGLVKEFNQRNKSARSFFFFLF